MHELALFAGCGGGILGGKLLGWQTVCAVENDPYCIATLCQRQNDGILAPFPIWDDVRTFYGKTWRGYIDVVSGGFPCQDISCAGKGTGITGARSGLWFEMARIVREVEPRFVFVENSPALTSRGLDRVLGDLAKMGYDAQWGVLGTRNTTRICWGERIWILAQANSHNGTTRLGTNERTKRKQIFRKSESQRIPRTGSMGMAPPNRTLGMDHELAHWMDRAKAVGNGQDPTVAALAWEILTCI